MSRMFLVAALVLMASAVLAENTLVEINWANVKAEGNLKAGDVVSRDGVQALKVTNPGDTALTVTILTIEGPAIAALNYAITGEVSYEDVQGQAYLEMLNYFPEDGPFFSRTLSDGPMRPLTGSSAFRPFALPFLLEAWHAKPITLELNVVLPGKGTVYIGPIKLVQDWSGSATAMVAGQWWDSRTGGQIGAVIGIIMGTLGALIGLLSSLGKGRVFVIGLLYATLFAGALCEITGTVALLKHQPWVVYYPLFLSGTILLVVSAVILPTAKRRFCEIEIRRMSARDAV